MKSSDYFNNFFKNKTILIVDDDNDAIEEIYDILNKYFKNVITASNGLECIEYLEYYKPDILLTDIKMPKFSGLEAIEKIREHDYEIPIIVMSAHHDEEFLYKASNLDVQGYVFKPIDVSLLKRILKKISNRHSKINSETIKINNEVEFDKESSLIILNDQNIPLASKEKELLNLFIKKSGQTVSYETIENEIWDKNDEVMSAASLRTLIKNLRQKIGKDLIKNISKVGYRLDIG